ncbi:MAG TPA: sigma 54-dependent Fis family transcriptional regulator [Polyangiaceae bacterium]|jgi:DNA-binding NtrC family response regulator
MAPDDDTAEGDEVSTLLRASRFDPTPLADVAFDVIVVSGPDRGKSLAISGASANRLLVGSSPACDLVLTDRAISRRHLALELEGRRVRLGDLGSTNGTSIQGLAVVTALLVGGETVHLGDTVFRLEVRAPSSAPVLPIATRFGRLLGASTEMRRIYPLCERLAAAAVPVLIEGETGTGKEVLAESLHEQGPRSEGPFVVFDCTAVAPNLVESELFGHERGAFTGAVSTRKGVFEQAHGGTLLIDEIGDLDPALQPKLLRVLERGEVRRVGGSRSIPVDVRILAATRRDLDREVQLGRFRDDLFHRLVVARVELPPLRARRGDVSLLVRHFAAELGGDAHAISPALLQQWETDAWPGNVRELRNAVARRLALGELAGVDGGEVRDETAGLVSLEAVVSEVVTTGLPFVRARDLVLDEFTRRYTERMLSLHGGNVVRAAAASGIGRRYFQRMRARHR